MLWVSVGVILNKGLTSSADLELEAAVHGNTRMHAKSKIITIARAMCDRESKSDGDG